MSYEFNTGFGFSIVYSHSWFKHRTGSTKLTEDQVREIRTSKELGKVLAKRFNVGPTTIYSVRNNESWRSLK